MEHKIEDYHIEDYPQLLDDTISRLPDLIDGKSFVNHMTMFIDADMLREPKLAEYLKNTVGHVFNSMAAHLNEADDDVAHGFRM